MTFTVAVPICISSIIYKSSSFPYILVYFLVFLTLAIMNWLRRNLKVVLIRIYLLAKDGGHLKLFLAICLSSENSLYSPTAHFLIWFFVLSVVNFVLVSCII